MIFLIITTIVFGCLWLVEYYRRTQWQNLCIRSLEQTERAVALLSARSPSSYPPSGSGRWGTRVPK